MLQTRRLLTLLPVALLFAARALAGGSIAWDKDWQQALDRAAQEKKVLFLAVNMDGESANDRMAQKVYSDERVTAAAALTVNLIASRFDHATAGRPCPRFGGLECVDHKRVDGAARQNVLKGDKAGYVIAPQHVFIGPDGKILLSVPYEISAEELAWCLAAAVRQVDPEAGKALPPVGRAPRRLISGGVFDPSTVPGANLAPPTKEQVDAIIKELRASFWGEGRELKLLQLLLSPEPAAMEFIGLELKNDMFGRRGWVRGDPTNPDGSGSGDRQDRLMHAIGVLSPPCYWKVVEDYLGHEDEKLRNEAVVALEQLAAPESAKAIMSALLKEKSATVRKDLMRALGSAGTNDDKARKALLKATTAEKDEFVRRNAIVALGWLSPGSDVNKALADFLAGPVPEQREAAAIAMGLSRNEAWVTFLEQANGADATPQFKPVAEAAIAVLKGSSLALLRLPIRTLCGDTIEREKFFGPGQ